MSRIYLGAAAFIAALCAALFALEQQQAHPDWPRAVERSAFLILGLTAVVLPTMVDAATNVQRGSGSKRRRHRDESEKA